MIVMLDALGAAIEVSARPRFEGANICSWIGFKHVCYLLEEAVVERFRRAGLGPRRLFEEYGLCLEIVDTDARILHALHLDDPVRIEVRPVAGDAPELAFALTVRVPRDGRPVKAVSATVRVLLRRDTWGGPPAEVPEELRRHTVPAIARVPAKVAQTEGIARGRGEVGAADDLAVHLRDGDALVWKWRIPYFYCHYTQRLQQSGYLRLLEEVVDLFLADRGISIATVLATNRCIPVVPHASMRILREALMEEDIYTVLKVQDIFKDLLYTARMDCYVRRDGGLVQTATGSITHGYAVIVDRRDWRLVPFDAEIAAALRGSVR
jgi:acyl-CoA thioesterase FadM